jgi:hypothetical protein
MTEEILKWILKISQTRQPEGVERIYLAEQHNNKSLASIEGRDIFE